MPATADAEIPYFSGTDSADLPAKFKEALEYTDVLLGDSWKTYTPQIAMPAASTEVIAGPQTGYGRWRQTGCTVRAKIVFIVPSNAASAWSAQLSGFSDWSPFVFSLPVASTAPAMTALGTGSQNGATALLASKRYPLVPRQSGWPQWIHAASTGTRLFGVTSLAGQANAISLTLDVTYSIASPADQSAAVPAAPRAWLLDDNTYSLLDSTTILA